MDFTNLDKEQSGWVTRIINAGIALGGSQVTEENYQERLKICRFCDQAGTVQINLPGKSIFLSGCKACGCPFATKPRWKKYWSLTKIKFVQATCPHKSGNKWQLIDNFFNQKDL